MPQYRPADLARATALNASATATFRAGTDAKANDDQYILSTVFFAAVLFFAGISLRLAWLRLRLVVLTLAGVRLLGGSGLVTSLPVAGGASPDRGDAATVPTPEDGRHDPGHPGVP